MKGGGTFDNEGCGKRPKIETFSGKLQVKGRCFFLRSCFFSIPLVSILSTGRSVVLPELCRDLLDGVVLRFRHLEPDVDDEQHLGHDEDDEDVGTEKELKNKEIRASQDLNLKTNQKS